MVATIILPNTVRIMGCYTKGAVIMRQAVFVMMKRQGKCGQQKKRQDQDREPCPVFVKAV
jgi:hypothetical protein